MISFIYGMLKNNRNEHIYGTEIWANIEGYVVLRKTKHS